MRIAIYGKTADPGKLESIQLLIDELKSAVNSITVNQGFYHSLKELNMPGLKSLKTYSKHSELVEQADFLFSVGGDGTFLDTISLVRDSGIPILGINTGRLGFLSNTSTSEIKTAVQCIINEEYRIEKRSLLEVRDSEKLFNDDHFALNEVSVLKKDSSSMITIEVQIDGRHLNTYWTDGLIISTSTGSTAYSLSCGGPILMPGSGNFVITPIAPHNLNVRPIVISDDSVLDLYIEGRSDSSLISLDSRSREIKNKNSIQIQKAKHEVHMVQLPNHSFIQSLKNKLNWGLDKRNI